jgi:hypothetical protein
MRTHDEGRSVINGQRMAYKPGNSVGDMYAEMAARENKKCKYFRKFKICLTLILTRTLGFSHCVSFFFSLTLY